MTKQEYKDLLESDYWKGFSFSIIKERNFTCEDCGAYYPGERNKLQVHHLVYRDINPWSYAPNEMVVLCRDCHEKRHGITHPQENPFDDDEIWSDLDANGWDKVKHYIRLFGNKIADWRKEKEETPQYYYYYKGKRRWKGRRKSHNWLFFIILLLFFGGVFLLVNNRNSKQSESSRNNSEIVEKKSSKKTKRKKKKSKKIETETEVGPFQEVVIPDAAEPEIIEESKVESNYVPITSNSTIEESSVE